MTDLFDVLDSREETELDPEPVVLPPPPASGLACEECGTTIEWSGRGRKPKRCVEHRSRTSARVSGTAAPRRSAKLDARLATLEGDITRGFAGLGHGASAFLPVFGVVTISESANVARVMTRIAATNEHVLSALESGAKVLPMFDATRIGFRLSMAIAVDLKRADPDSFGAKLTGVSEVYHEIYGDETPQSETDNVSVGFPEVSVPPRFAA